MRHRTYYKKPKINRATGFSDWVLGFRPEFKPCKWLIMRVDSVGRWEIAQTGKMHDVYGAAFEDSVFSPEAPIYWTRIPSDPAL